MVWLNLTVSSMVIKRDKILRVIKVIKEKKKQGHEQKVD